MPDRELLREYAERGSESSFQTLVQRHVDLVFATAVRRLGDAAAAQEITQDVFIMLARKAAWLRGEATLVGWLHKTTLFAARQWWRGELRRRRREQTAVELGTTMKDDASLLKSLAGVLDEGLMELREADRQALMLRYFEERSHREIGALLGANEDAVRKRIDKALHKLTGFFRRRGHAVPAVATTTAALRAAAQAAPAGLTGATTKAALSAGGAASVAGLSLLLAKFMGLTKTQTAALCLLVSAAPAAYEWTVVGEAKAEHRDRQSQLSSLDQTLTAHQHEQERLERRLRSTDNSLAQLEGDQARRKALALAVPSGEDPKLYRWSEASDCVRLPKSMFSRIKFYDAAVDSVGTNSAVPEWSPTLTKNGKVSSVTLEVLGLDEAVSAQVEKIFLDFARDYRELEKSHTILTNIELETAHKILTNTMPPNTLPQGLHLNSDFQSLSTAAFPAEGEALKARLRTSLEQVMGKERAELLWQSLAREFYHEFNKFGAIKRTFILQMIKEGSPLLHDSAHGLTLLRPLDQIPEEFRPFVEEWKLKHLAQTP